MESLVKVHFVYCEDEVKIKILVKEKENCLDWIVPGLDELLDTQNIVMGKLEETLPDLVLHNGVMAEKILKVQGLMARYPEVIASIFDDLGAIQKSVNRMKQRFGIQKSRE
jgi:hypothetical protein